MMIDLNNYETWFLQYADGECSPSEQQSVESFLLVHPELREELDQMMELRFLPEDISMPGKELLHFSELEMLNEQYRVEPDPDIVFPDRQLLYKKEGSRIVYLYRTLSAAAVLLFGMGLYWMLSTNDPIEKSIAGEINLPISVEQKDRAEVSVPSAEKILQPSEKPIPTPTVRTTAMRTSESDPIAPIEMQPDIQDVVIVDPPVKVQEITKPISNLSEEALKAAAIRLESNSAVIPVAVPINTSVLISDETKSTEKKSLRSLVRTVSRRLIHEEDEQQDSKFIQVASFHIHIKN
jgi:hypothetical protein